MTANPQASDLLAGLVAEPAGYFITSGGASVPATPAGLSPAQVAQAYGFNQIRLTSALGASVVGNGAGQTIAIVNAYHDPNIAADLKVFDRQFGLADPVLTQVAPFAGGGTLPTNANWAAETSLDVEWAHAMAPAAKILLVETTTTNLSDLLAAVKYAAAQPNVSVVSLSWGVGEFAGEAALDSTFVTPAGHAPVTFVAATGDTAGSTLWPAAAPNVVAVGGTSLTTSGTGAYVSESVWANSGGGASFYETEPAAQRSVQSTGKRTTPDVAYDANPQTGLAVYDSFGATATSGWRELGGTSAGTPQWAALLAITNQGRALKGLTNISNATTALYALPAADFHDVTQGASGTAATTGYDLATGRGSPIANLVVSGLVGSVATPAIVATTTTATVTASTSTSSSLGISLRMLTSSSASSGAAARLAWQASAAISDPGTILARGIAFSSERSWTDIAGDSAIVDSNSVKNKLTTR